MADEVSAEARVAVAERVVIGRGQGLAVSAFALAVERVYPTR